jgi:hypothetical protein
MARDPEPIVRAILDRHGRTFSEGIGLRVERGTPAALFGLPRLVAGPVRVQLEDDFDGARSAAG